MHVNAEWVTVILAVFSVLLIPALVILVRAAIKWTKIEDKLGTLVEDVKKLVSDKDKVHAEILEAMRADREATDRRLRWVEEWFMSQGMKNRS